MGAAMQRLIQEYLRELDTEGSSPPTVRSYRIDLTQFLAVLRRMHPEASEAIPLDRIDPLTVRAFMASLRSRGLSPRNLRPLTPWCKSRPFLLQLLLSLY